MSFLRLDGVAKTYPDGTRAVHRVDLAVDEGEFIVLLGPSGCGKTTTLRMVAGLELATAGSIRLAGADVTALPPSRRDIGFVFQFYALYPHLRVADNIGFPLEAEGVPRRERERRVSEVAAAIGVTGLLGAYPRQLSGGDQQRVSLARALVRQPRLWLMDEPLGTLDAAVRAQLGDFIRTQQRARKITTLFVTHDQEEAMRLADRVVVMEGGLVRQIGRPAEVLDRPATRFVGHFVGSPGMNFLDAVVAGGRLRRDGLDLPVAGADGPVVVGVRPDRLRLAADGIAAEVVLDEYQGDHRLLHAQAGGTRLTVRVAAHDRHAPGAAVRIAVDPAGVRLFDPGTGDAR